MQFQNAELFDLRLFLHRFCFLNFFFRNPKLAHSIQGVVKAFFTTFFKTFFSTFFQAIFPTSFFSGTAGIPGAYKAHSLSDTFPCHLKFLHCTFINILT